jgi:transcription antitermination protein NusB
MPTGRRSARRHAVFILYQQDLLKLNAEQALTRAGDSRGDEYTAALVRGVGGHLSEIDEVLSKHVEGWSLQRLGVLERAILRLAAYELIWEPGVPSAVVLDEAVASAKRFCSDEAGSLVNGVLGAVAGTVRVEEAEA